MSDTLQYKVSTMLTPLKTPGGFIPAAISATLPALIADRVARFGTLYRPDEGAGAKLFFAIRRLPQRRLAALEVLAVPVFALVYEFHG